MIEKSNPASNNTSSTAAMPAKTLFLLQHVHAKKITWAAFFKR
jgi:hypothetical protein